MEDEKKRYRSCIYELWYHKRGILISTHNGMEFELNEVQHTFKPRCGDILEIIVDKDSKIETINPIGLETKKTVVICWNGSDGICRNKIYFDKDIVPAGVKIVVGLHVITTTIESVNDECTSRVIQMKVDSEISPKNEGIVSNEVADNVAQPAINFNMAANVDLRKSWFCIPEHLLAIFFEGSNQSNDNVTVTYKMIEKLEARHPFLMQELTVYDYFDKWHIILFLDEIEHNINMTNAYNIQRTVLTRFGDLVNLVVHGVADRKPSLSVGDVAIATDLDSNVVSRGVIRYIRENSVLLKFTKLLHILCEGANFSIKFRFNRRKYHILHRAIDLAIVNLGQHVLLPRRLLLQKPLVSDDALMLVPWFNKHLNYSQKAAVTNILQGECRPMPYCIFGPPGTGKTVTVVETILQILKNIPHSKVIVATPSNGAANLITERLIYYQAQYAFSVARIVSHSLVESGTLPSRIKSHCVMLSSRGDPIIRNGIGLINGRGVVIGTHQVTIGTCNILEGLSHMEFKKGHFTHVIVDEAGQATEPETMIPLGLVSKKTGQIILAGDPMQLGPVVFYRLSVKYGLAKSFLSRLLETDLYKKDTSSCQQGFNPKLITKLNDNYRSLFEVFNLPSKMFYEGSLVEKINRDKQWIKELISVVSDLFNRGKMQAAGIFVHGIKGNNIQAERNTSWYNPEEAEMVASTVSQMYMRNVSPEDICIMSPYKAQIRYIKDVFYRKFLDEPEIGTVDNFQGREKPIVILSTVRSEASLLNADTEDHLGFLKDPKRLNVAFTRAQVATILICDPHALCVDPHWSQYVQDAVKTNKYMGCDHPTKFASH